MQTHVFSTLLTGCLSLDNGVQIAFIEPSENNASVNKACISICLHQGHFDASGFPDGFSHLYEHMLFNASSQYKNVDALDNHLLTHHGQVNGWTQNTSTHFNLRCDSAGFTKACKILTNRLTSPLFLHEHIEKEILAIDAEFNTKKSDVVRQLLSVQQQNCNIVHPFSKFSIGNLATLGQLSTRKTRTLLQKYHQKVMQGKYLYICVGIAANIDKQQIHSTVLQQLQSDFGKVRSNENDAQKNKDNNAVPVFLPENLNQYIQIKHCHNRHQLIISFILPTEQFTPSTHHQETVFLVLCHLIESKHQHGLFDLLHTHKLATDIHSYYNTLDSLTGELVVSISLSDTGAQMPQNVYHYVQHFINFLCKSAIEPWRLRENKNQQDLSRLVSRRSGILEDCMAMLQYMALAEGAIAKPITPSAVIDINTVIAKYILQNNMQQDDELAILASKILRVITQQNVRVHFISPLAATTMCSPHFNTPFAASALQTASHSLIAQHIFSKPRKNPYVASQYPLVKKQRDANDVLHIKSKYTQLKFYQELRFSVPNGHCYISISDPHMFGSSAKSLAKRVWLSCLNEHLASVFFDVELASIHYRVYAHHHGITIHTGGLSERQLLLCIELVNAILGFRASKDDIERHLHKTRMTINNKPNQRPINQLFSALNEHYQPDGRKSHATSKGIHSITVEQILSQQSLYFGENYIESLLIGNWQVESVKRFHTLVNSRFNGNEHFTKPTLTVLPMGNNQHVQLLLPASKDNCFVWHFIPIVDEQEKALTHNSLRFKLILCARALMLEKLLSHTVFAALRQQHNMGYELGVGYKPVSRYPGIVLYAVSQSHSTNAIEQGMYQAINDAKIMLEKNQVDILQMVEELKRQVTPKDTDISQTATRTWLHFDDNNPILAYEELVEALGTITKTDILNTLKSLANTQLGQVTMAVGAKETILQHTHLH